MPLPCLCRIPACPSPACSRVPDSNTCGRICRVSRVYSNAQGGKRFSGSGSKRGSIRFSEFAHPQIRLNCEEICRQQIVCVCFLCSACNHRHSRRAPQSDCSTDAAAATDDSNANAVQSARIHGTLLCLFRSVSFYSLSVPKLDVNYPYADLIIHVDSLLIT